MNLHSMSNLSEALRLPSAYFNKISIVQESKLTNLISNQPPAELQNILNEDVEEIETSLRKLAATSSSSAGRICAGVGSEVPDTLFFSLLVQYNVNLSRPMRDTIYLAISRNPSSKLVNLKIFIALIAFWKSKSNRSISIPSAGGSVSLAELGRVTIKRLIDEFPDILHVIDVYHSRIKLEGRSIIGVQELSSMIPGSVVPESTIKDLTQLGYINPKTNIVSVAKLAEDLNLAVHPSGISKYKSVHQANIDDGVEDNRLIAKSKFWYSRLVNVKDVIIKELGNMNKLKMGGDNISKQSFKSILLISGFIMSFDDFDSFWELLKETEIKLLRQKSNEMELSTIAIQYFFQKYQPVHDNQAISVIMGTNDRNERRPGTSNIATSIGDSIFQTNLLATPSREAVASASSSLSMPTSASRKSYMKEMDGQSRANSLQNLWEIPPEDAKTPSSAGNLRFAQSNQKYNNSSNNDNGVSSLLNQANIKAEQLKVSERNSSDFFQIASGAVVGNNGKKVLDLSSHNELKYLSNVKSNIIHRINEQLNSSLSLSKLVLDIQSLQRKNGNALSRFAIQEAMLINGIKLSPAVGDGLWSELGEFSKPGPATVASLFAWLGLPLPALSPVASVSSVRGTSATASHPLSAVAGDFSHPLANKESTDFTSTTSVNTNPRLVQGSNQQGNHDASSGYVTPVIARSPSRDVLGSSAPPRETGVFQVGMLQMPGYDPAKVGSEWPSSNAEKNENRVAKDSNNSTSGSMMHTTEQFKSLPHGDHLQASIKDKLRQSKTVAGDRVKLLALTSQLRNRLRHKLARGDRVSFEASDTCSAREFQSLLESVDVWLSLEECEYISSKISEYNNSNNNNNNNNNNNSSSNNSSNSNNRINSATPGQLYQIGEFVLTLSQIIR